jgi:hypothetical protein
LSVSNRSRYPETSEAEATLETHGCRVVRQRDWRIQLLFDGRSL